jgi:hypothetical protein
MRGFIKETRMRLSRALVLALASTAFALPVLGQGMPGSSTPLALDLKKVPVGSWSEYSMTIGPSDGMMVKSRWALVARDSSSNTMEMSAEGGPAAGGGKIVIKLVLVPDPVSSEKPVKKMIMKMGENDPMEMPLDMPGMPSQRFEKPDPKNLVGTESVKTDVGTFKASHYRDANAAGTVDAWISQDVAPLGIVKLISTPKAGTAGPGGQPMPPVTMQLASKGKGAKPAITKPAKPFDPSVFGGPPAGAKSPPAAAPAKK